MIYLHRKKRYDKICSKQGYRYYQKIVRAKCRRHIPVRMRRGPKTILSRQYYQKRNRSP